MKLGQITQIFWLAGAIGVFDINPVLSQQVQITPTLREERASQQFNDENKLFDMTCCAAGILIISDSFEDEKYLFDLNSVAQRAQEESRLLEKCCLLLAANESFQDAEKDLKVLTGIKVGHSTYHRQVQKVDTSPPFVKQKLTEVCLDGGKVRLRSTEKSTDMYR
jgi:hypothetical protein